jgi:hypothetical protein
MKRTRKYKGYILTFAREEVNGEWWIEFSKENINDFIETPGFKRKRDALITAKKMIDDIINN